MDGITGWEWMGLLRLAGRCPALRGEKRGERLLAVGVVWVLVCGWAWGGWDTNAWPSWEWQSKGYEQSAQVYTAMVWRAAAAAAAAPTAPRWWRSQRYMLTEWKSGLKTIIPAFVDYRQADTNGRFEAWFAATNTAPPMLTVTGVLVDARMPTNWLDYTPYTSLNGYGWDTNDATVGHWHGWSNAKTQAGGTNFPAGRTNWYTTDYGWSRVTNVLDLLRWTKRQPNNDASTLTYEMRCVQVDGSMTLADAYAQFASEWSAAPWLVNSNIHNPGGAYGCAVTFDAFDNGYFPPDLAVTLFGSRERNPAGWVVADLPLIAQSADHYIGFEFVPGGVPVPYDFDDVIPGVVSNFSGMIYYYCESFAEATVGARTSVLDRAESSPVAVMWPSGLSTNEMGSWGIQEDLPEDAIWVFKWAFDY